MMPALLLQSILTDSANMIAMYLAEIWGFLIFIGQLCAFIVVLAGAILWFTDANSGEGKGLLLSGILLAIVGGVLRALSPKFCVTPEQNRYG